MKIFSFCSSVVLLFLAASLSGVGQFERLPHETYRLDWPTAENWKIGSRQENDNMLRVDMVGEPEHTGKSVTMLSYKGVQKMDVENVMNAIYQEFLRECYNSRITVIEKDINAEYPWIIFTVECRVFDNGAPGESQVWQIVQGKFALYTLFRSFSTAPSPDDIQKTAEFFKTGRVMYSDN